MIFALAGNQNSGKTTLFNILTGQMDYDDGDIYLDEFADEIDMWVIDEFKKNGFDTALSVLNVSRDELLRRTDLEEETIDDVLAILKSEFEDFDEAGADNNDESNS